MKVASTAPHPRTVVIPHLEVGEGPSAACEADETPAAAIRRPACEAAAQMEEIPAVLGVLTVAVPAEAGGVEATRSVSTPRSSVAIPPRGIRVYPSTEGKVNTRKYAVENHSNLVILQGLFLIFTLASGLGIRYTSKV